MNFAFSTNAYRNYSIEESIRSIASIGFSGIEIMCDTPHAFPPLTSDRLNSIKKTLEQNNMSISNLNGFMLCAIENFHHPSWIEKSSEYRKKRVEHTKNCIKLAKELGAHSVSTEPGGPPTHNSLNKDFDLFAKGISEVLPIAEENKIRLLIEPEPGLIIENSTQFLNFIEKFDSQFLGLNFDVGHFYCVGEKPENLIRNLQDYIYHIHLEDISKSRVHYHLIPGTGSIDFKKIFKSINDINYQGYVTVELYPYQSNPEEAARKSLEFLNSIIM